MNAVIIYVRKYNGEWLAYMPNPDGSPSSYWVIDKTKRAAEAFFTVAYDHLPFDFTFIEEEVV